MTNEGKFVRLKASHYCSEIGWRFEQFVDVDVARLEWLMSDRATASKVGNSWSAALEFLGMAVQCSVCQQRYNLGDAQGVEINRQIVTPRRDVSVHPSDYSSS